MILLHGLGGAADLPLPLPLAIIGGTVAVTITFLILGLAWKTARFEGPRASPGRASRLTRAFDSRAWDVAMSILGLAIFGWCTWALLAGGNINTNPIFGTFYVLVWVGVVPLSLAFGRVGRALSPWRALTRFRCWISGISPDRGLLTYPEKLGYWPAALGVFAFVWQELVSADQVSLPAVQVWLGVYAAAMLLGSMLFGLTWLDHADPFQAYSDLLAKVSPWGRDADGDLVVCSPLRNLATLPSAPGLLALLAILFGSTIYDSAKDSTAWISFVEGLPFSPIAVGTATLIVSWLAVGLTFSIAGRFNGPRTIASGSLPALLAPSLVPIIVGYMTAHYLSYFFVQSQITLNQLSDPMSTGANYLGTATWATNLWLIENPSFLATVKVLAIVIGHIVGALAAHDRTIALVEQNPGSQPDRLPPGTTMAVLMLAYTSTGLILLFGV